RDAPPRRCRGGAGGRRRARGGGGERRRHPHAPRPRRAGPARPAGQPPRGAGAERAYGDTFVEASIGDIGALIPSLTTDSPSHEVGGLVYDQLIRTDKNITS